RQDEAPTDRLAREWYWKGAAWYQKEVVIPDSWKGKRITLFLERTKNARVWVDEKFCGWDDSLSAPHVHDLSSVLTPGKHRITLLIDNSILPPVGPSHAVDERTQTNWNGVVGELELRATDPVWIKDVQVFPDVAKKSAIARVTIGNITGKAAEGQIQIRAASENTDKKLSFDPLTAKVAAADAETTLELECRMGDDVPLWSEFDPALIRLTLDLEAGSEGSAFEDQRTIRFGMRDFRSDGSQLTLNGMNVFLRGRLDCANYPLTGYAPMSKEEWVEIYQILKDWGLNHVRFHSWCPPKAAFEAADEVGFYLQAELPNKRSGFKAPENQDAAYHNIDRLDVESSDSKVELYDYAKREAELIFEHFGNHPSFVMFTLGNELGRNQGMFDLVELFKKTDPRHLHAQGANNMHWNPSLAEGDEFWVTGKVEKGAKPLRGSFSLFDFPAAPIEGYPPSTMDDFSESIEGVPVPLIGHETGQFQVAPDFRDIPKFTGVLKAKNYEIFRSRLEEAGMLDQADLFVKASGALSALCYREDIELALRTPGFGGFQLLDIMDFPGQGTALVGMLNVFMESKGVITPIEWRRFCAPVVPLVRMEKHAWTSDESFEGLVQVAHYGANDLPEAELWWSLTGSDGNKITGGKLQPTTVNQGGLV
ncbi:MAG: glycoside hydrolase family 2 TIM barrel-domain containing protein, partial [Haloferula sp.]